MSLIDEINNYREIDKKENAIIDVNDEIVIDTMYKCMVNYIKYYILYYAKSNLSSWAINKADKLVGFVFINDLCSTFKFKELTKLSEDLIELSEHTFEEYFNDNIHKYYARDFLFNTLRKAPVTICLCNKPLDLTLDIYYFNDTLKVSKYPPEDIFKAVCNSLTDNCGPIIYKYNGNKIALYPFAYEYDNESIRNHINIKEFFMLSSSAKNNFDNLIINLSELLKNWFDQEGLINNNVNVTTFNQIVPMKLIPCHTPKSFGRPELVNAKQIFPSNCNNKVIAFEVEW